METNDTIKLLKECDSGTKMAVSSIDDVITNVSDEKFKALLNESKSTHTKLGNKIHELLLKNNEQDKDPNPIAKGMSWMKTNVKMMVNESDKTIADLMTEGCNMGVKSLSKYLNQYSCADETSKKICKELISCEEKLVEDIRCYL